jgi:hypothetical protein
MSGAVIVGHQNRLMRRFRDAQATGPKSARTLAELDCRDSWIFRRMAAWGVFIGMDDGRYYMDEEKARWFVKRRWQRMLVFLATVILLFVVWMIFS